MLYFSLCVYQQSKTDNTTQTSQKTRQQIQHDVLRERRSGKVLLQMCPSAANFNSEKVVLGTSVCTSLNSTELHQTYLLDKYITHIHKFITNRNVKPYYQLNESLLMINVTVLVIHYFSNVRVFLRIKFQRFYKTFVFPIL